jgi:hypothetical protein
MFSLRVRFGLHVLLLAVGTTAGLDLGPPKELLSSISISIDNTAVEAEAAATAAVEAAAEVQAAAKADAGVAAKTAAEAEAAAASVPHGDCAGLPPSLHALPDKRPATMEWAEAMEAGPAGFWRQLQRLEPVIFRGAGKGWAARQWDSSEKDA